MARRSIKSSKRAKARPRKAETLKRHAAPNLSRRSSPTVGKESVLRRERDEALERETAISEVLRIISNSPAELQSVLGAIAESAARLLDVSGAEISRRRRWWAQADGKAWVIPAKTIGIHTPDKSQVGHGAGRR